MDLRVKVAAVAVTVFVGAAIGLAAGYTIDTILVLRQTKG